MTYYEAYSRCKTIDELKYAIKKDSIFAVMYNPDRLKYINDATLKVIKEHFPDYTGDDIVFNGD